MKKISALWLVALLSACAVEDFPDERQSDPAASARDRVGIAAQYLQKGDSEQAQRHVKRALALDPKSAEAHNIMGVLLEKEGDNKGAEKHYRRAVSLRDNYSQAHNNFGVFLFKRGEYAEAADQLEKAASDLSYDRRDQALENLGRASIKAGRRERAEWALGRALRLNPNLPTANLELAILQFERGDSSSARNVYKRFLELTPNQPQSAASLWLGIRLERVFGDKDALASYELALRRLYPKSPEFQAYQESLPAGKSSK